MNYDVTELKTIELTLEDRVNARTRELEFARRAAESASLAKSTFLTNMSHEIRTPLNAINGMTYLMERDGVTAEQAARLKQIKVSSAHLLDLINDILDLSKIEAGRFSLQDNALDLSGIISNVTAMLASAADAKRIPLVVEYHPDATPLRGDGARLQQALLNYVSNAIKFSHGGIVTIHVLVDEDQPDYQLLRFEVEDQGIGIAPEVAEKLFHPFEQAESGHNRRFGGPGLGLVLTRKLAELMGGSVGVRSIPRHGSVFWFTARLRKGGNQTQQATRTLPLDALQADLRQRFGHCRLLLVEDDPANRIVTTLMLEDVWPVIAVAENGREALAMVSESSYDLILMDLQMPEMDGLEATCAIRALAHGGDMPILALTANVFEEDRRRCSSVGMDGFISKPVDAEQLFRAIHQHLLSRQTI